MTAVWSGNRPKRARRGQQWLFAAGVLTKLSDANAPAPNVVRLKMVARAHWRAGVAHPQSVPRAVGLLPELGMGYGEVLLHAGNAADAVVPALAPKAKHAPRVGARARARVAKEAGVLQPVVAKPGSGVSRRKRRKVEGE